MVIVGPGRAGTALYDRAVACGVAVRLVRDVRDAASAGTVLLAVGDRDLAAVASAVRGASFVGMLSGSTPLGALGDGPGRFALHPAQTLARDAGAGQLDDVTAFISAASPQAERHAVALAGRLALHPRVVTDQQRLLEHAACVFASNYVVTLLGRAVAILEAAGVASAEAKGVLLPLVRRTLSATLECDGPVRPTGPVARGDDETIRRQLAALARFDPGTAELYAALGRATLPLVDDAAAARAVTALGAGGGV
jgi:predicted short-subunit dehydrogenase-like oxidoreductase (DUF2520 family)